MARTPRSRGHPGTESAKAGGAAGTFKSPTSLRCYDSSSDAESADAWVREVADPEGRIMKKMKQMERNKKRTSR